MLLTTYGNYLWTQDTGAFKDVAESGDAFGRSVAVGAFVVKYLNRLSDALFVMARWENRHRGVADVTWNSRL